MQPSRTYPELRRQLRRWEPRIAVGFLGLLAGVVQGCVIPTGEHLEHVTISRRNVSKESTEQIVPGTTTLADVLLALGEPDVVSANGQMIAYRWVKFTAWWAIPMPGFSVSGVFRKDYYLVVESDPTGVVLTRYVTPSDLYPVAGEERDEVEAWSAIKYLNH